MFLTIKKIKIVKIELEPSKITINNERGPMTV